MAASVAHHGPAGQLKAAQDRTVSTPAQCREVEVRGNQGLPFGIQTPEICLMCSPALVNWLLRNSDWMRIAS